MKAILLAAGRGSRLGDRTKDIPKCLTPLAGRPLLYRQLQSLQKAGLRDIAIVRGYQAESIDTSGMHSFFNKDWAITNMVASLALAEPWLSSGPCLVSYTDIVYPAHAASQLLENDADIAILYDAHWLELWSARFTRPLDDAETFRLTPNGRLSEIGSRATRLEDIQGQYMGLLRFSPKGWAHARVHWESLPLERRARLDMTSLLSGLLKEGIEVSAIPYMGHWGEVDRPEDLALYEKWLESDPDYFEK